MSSRRFPPALAALLLLLCVPLVLAEAPAREFVRDDPLTSQRTAWYREAKFGMFIHWGLYSVPAGQWKGRDGKLHDMPGLGEWIMHDASIPIPEYERLAKGFDPVKFDAKQWVAVAKDAGMKYIVITSKHHDGFCMFATKATPYNIVDATPFHRDPLKELSAACKESGIKFCCYHSIMDWHHPELATSANTPGAKDPNDPAVLRYIEVQLKPQLRELVVKYDPAILWFDGEWVPWWNQQHGNDLEAYLHHLKPDIMVNNRIGKRTTADGDYETPEQEIPKSAQGKRLWETCMTLNDTWGYKKNDHHWKSSDAVIQKLNEINGKGGNFLLNVGPTAEGIIPKESVQILHEVGDKLRQK
jgi:alpha-L-fucosidase